MDGHLFNHHMRRARANGQIEGFVWGLVTMSVIILICLWMFDYFVIK